jgi:2-oxo-4-hydroxy-4-carboxy-5-ureidoimidazoline decarboxylase
MSQSETRTGPNSAPGRDGLRLDEFNQLDRDAAMQALRPCLDIDRWQSEIADARPFAAVAELLETARHAAEPFTAAEVEAALAHHPRIGEQAAGASAEAALSRSEQAGLDASPEIADKIVAGNQAYEERFGRVFLIQAAGRSGEEILYALEARLRNDPETEDRVVADQLREIALLRLAGQVSE